MGTSFIVSHGPGEPDRRLWAFPWTLFLWGSRGPCFLVGNMIRSEGPLTNSARIHRCPLFSYRRTTPFFLLYLEPAASSPFALCFPFYLPQDGCLDQFPILLTPPLQFPKPWFPRARTLSRDFAPRRRRSFLLFYPSVVDPPLQDCCLSSSLSSGRW